MTDSYTTGDRPATTTEEIEITPEMIEAGAAIIAAYSNEYEAAEDAARRVYRAMTESRFISRPR